MLHPFEKKMLDFCRSHSLFPAGAPVVAAVSGGVDSVAMLAALAALKDGLDLSLITAVYVDHGLRPDEIPAEKELVAGLAARFSCGFVCETVDARGGAEEEGTSLEAAARKLRYGALRRVAGDDGIIAVAHHGGDQAEELLLRLVRGTGLTGLAGMLPDNRMGVVRPLLGHRRQEIEAYVEDRELSFCHDSSNEDLSFLRNRVRHRLLPFLKQEFNPAMTDALNRTARILAAEDDFMRQQTSATLAACFRMRPDGGAELSLAEFAGLHPAMQRRVLDSCLWQVGCRAGMERVETLRDFAATGRPGARLHLPGGLRVLRERERMLFTYPLGRRPHREG